MKKKKTSFFKSMLGGIKLPKITKKEKPVFRIKSVKPLNEKPKVVEVRPLLKSIKEEESGLAKIYDRAAKAAIYLLVFLLPIFFLPWTANVLDFNKQALLIVLVFVSLFAWMLKVLAQGRINLNLTNFHIVIGVLFLVYLGSTLFSLWTYGSFWGWPLVSSESLLTLICFILLYLLVINMFEKKEIFNLMRLLVISGFLAIVFGILQIFGKFVLPWGFSRTSSFNSLGSINKLGIFSAVLMPLAVGLLMGRRRLGSFGKLGRGLVRAGLVLALVAFIVFIVMINFSAIWWLAIIGAGLLMVFGLQRSDLFDNRFLILPMFMLAVSLFFLFFNFQIPGVPARPIEVFLTHQTSFDIASQAIKENPIFGSGPGTFIYSFSKHKDISFNSNSFWNVRFDSARSKMLGMLGNLGILGLLGYLAVIGLFGFYGVKHLFKAAGPAKGGVVLSAPKAGEGAREKITGSFADAQDDKNAWLLAASIFISFAVLSTGYFLYSSNLVLDFVFFVLLGSFMVLLPYQRKEFELKPSSLFTLGITFFFTLVFIFGLGLFILEGQRYSAEMSYFKGVNAWQNGNTGQSLTYLEKSVRVNPKTDLYWRELSQIYLRKIQEEAGRTDIPRSEINQKIQLLINNSVNSAKKATDVNPENVANWSVRGFVYQNLVGVISGVNEWVKKSYEEALKLEPANAYYPTQAGISLLKEATFLSQDRTKEKVALALEAQEYFIKALQLKSDYAPAHFQMAMAYQMQGKAREAITELENAKSLAPQDVGLAFQLGLVYYQNQDYSSAEIELSRAVMLNPDYSNALYFLGLSYEKQGKKSMAIQAFTRLSQLNPDNSQIKRILENIKNDEPALKGITEQVPPEAPVEETPEEIEE